MNKRDLKADLELCNKTTPGPWMIADEPEVIIENTFSSPILFSAVAFEDDLGASKFEALKTEDLDFILQAREGWPHAIERAIKAEALAQKLLDVLGRVIPRYLVGRLELDLDSVLEANGLLKKAEEVPGDGEVR